MEHYTDPCYFKGREDWGQCLGCIDFCHLIPKQRIKRELRHVHDWDTLQLIVWDPRVTVPGCRKHHGELDNYIHRLRRDELPPFVWDYAREHNLEWSLERDFA